MPRDAIVFEAHVPAAEAARLKSGQRAIVSQTGVPDRPTVLERTLPVASASDQATLAWLAPATAAEPPALYRFGTATIIVGARRLAVAVPDSSLVEDDLTGAKRIAVVGGDSVAVWRAVTLGASADGWHEVTEPALAAGTRVIVVGQHGLPDSARVTIAP